MPPPAPLPEPVPAPLPEPVQEHLRKHAAMFQSMADILSWSDMESPAPAYPALFSDWKESTEETCAELIEAGEIELSQKDRQSFGVAKEVGYAFLEKFVGAARAVGWAQQPPEVRRAAVEALLALPQIPQRTAEWYAQGKQVLTASEFATLFKTLRAIQTLAKVKATPAVQAGPEAAAAPTTGNRLACMSCEMGPFDWGIRFEPVVKQILEKYEGVTVAEAGRLLHPSDPMLAASPDGLILDAADKRRVGRLVEIKCPISRAVGEGIPFEYWCQMQVQMEVTGIEECEYIEVKFVAGAAGSACAKGPTGHIWLLQDPVTAVMCYAYTPEARDAAAAKGMELIEEIPWSVEKQYREVVVRDKTWFRGTAELRAAFWKEVEAAKAAAAAAPPAPTQGVVVTKLPAAKPCLIED